MGARIPCFQFLSQQALTFIIMSNWRASAIDFQKREQNTYGYFSKLNCLLMMLLLLLKSEQNKSLIMVKSKSWKTLILQNIWLFSLEYKVHEVHVFWPLCNRLLMNTGTELKFGIWESKCMENLLNQRVTIKSWLWSAHIWIPMCWH